MSWLSGFFGRASYGSIRPLTLTDPEGWNVSPGKSASGKVVTPDSAMQLATAWACVRLKSRSVGTLPIAVYEKLPDGTRREASDHWLYALVHDSPNADQTAAEFWQGVVACIDLWGNAYAKKDVAGGGRVISLTPLRSDRMMVYRDENGARRYRYNAPWGPQEDWGEDEVFHVRGFTVGGDVGLSAISYGRQTLGSAQAADEAAAKFFANGMMSSGFLQPAATTKSTEAQRAEMLALVQKFAGSSQAGRVLPLPDGWTYQSMSMDPGDAQLLETRSFNVEEICRWFDVTPPVSPKYTIETAS